MKDVIQDELLKKKNIRTAWIVAGFAVLTLVSSLPFWMGMAKLMGEQAQ